MAAGRAADYQIASIIRARPVAPALAIAPLFASAPSHVPHAALRPCRKRCTPCSTSPSRPRARAGAIINRASLDLEPCCRSSTKAPNDFVTEVDHAAERGDHRHAARAPIPATASSPRSPAARAARKRQRLRLDHRSARRHDQLHPRLSGLRGVDRARLPRPGRSRPSSTTRRATTSSTPRKGRGAFLNDKRLRVSKRTRLADCADRHRLSVPQGRQLQALPARCSRR